MTEKNKKYIYLDYASTTPVDNRVLNEMLPYFKEKFGNTMSLHSQGQKAKVALEKSREKIAKLIGAGSPEEIIFTGSATESNNMALKAIAGANKEKGNHIIISSIEHDCVLNAAEYLRKQGFKITKLPVDNYGFISTSALKQAITDDTILVSIIHGNNEIGTIQPIEEIGEVIKKKSETLNLKSKIYFHTDAAQSLGKVPIDVKKMNVDLLTGSSHKMYGPKGVALLYVKNGTEIEPLLHGGGQENGLRSSTVNVPSIVGFAKAFEICSKEMKKESKRQIKLRDKLINNILDKVKNSHLSGHPQIRLPNNINFRFDFVEGESIVMKLDLLRVAASTGSACSSKKLKPSHVLLAIGLKPEQAHGSVRLSLGRPTKEKDIDYVIEKLPEIIKSLRKISPFKK